MRHFGHFAFFFRTCTGGTAHKLLRAGRGANVDRPRLAGEGQAGCGRGLPIITGSQSVTRIGLTQQRQIAERSAALTALENRLTLLCPGLARGKSVRAGIPVARAASA